MSVATDTLALFRTQWADRLEDSCVIREITGTALNTTTGVITPTYTQRYSGSCLVRPQSPSSAQVGEQLTEQRGYLVVIPYSETAIGVDMEVVVTSTTDAKLNGKVLIVRNVRTDTYNTARKLDCEDNQGG